MKRSIFIAAIVAVVFAASCSGGSGPAGGGPSAPTVSAVPAPAENADKIITQLEHDWVAAIVNKDTATIERLLDADFAGTTNDEIYSKADAIDDVKTGAHESLTLDNIKVRIFGDAAVVTMEQTEKSRHGDLDFSGQYLFTDVWVRKNGEWFAVASHGSRFR